MTEILGSEQRQTVHRSEEKDKKDKSETDKQTKEDDENNTRKYIRKTNRREREIKKELLPDNTSIIL